MWVKSTLVLLALLPWCRGDDYLCISNSKTFTVKVNLFAGELGYYTIDECGDMVNPTIGMEVGETYTFVQNDVSNFYHAIGFAYFPDGAHDDVDELEPGISQGTSGCDADMTCPAPMYFVGGEYAGVYSNIPEVTPVTTGEDDFGLDAYEPLFFYPILDWADMGPYEVKLRFDDTTYTKDIFYFCHIHQFMTGRIKLLSGGSIINAADEPVIPYEYDMPTGFDAECGTFLLNDFQLPNDQCPDRFVCDADRSSDPAFRRFASCIDAMNCHMMAGMTTGSSAESEAALFIHQMIPHHQNAVNMAKALMKSGLGCDNITNEDDPNCILETVIREIINGQNFQIQVMRAVAEAQGYPAEDDCVVNIETKKAKKVKGKFRKGKKSKSKGDY